MNRPKISSSLGALFETLRRPWIKKSIIGLAGGLQIMGVTLFIAEKSAPGIALLLLASWFIIFLAALSRNAKEMVVDVLSAVAPVPILTGILLLLCVFARAANVGIGELRIVQDLSGLISVPLLMCFLFLAILGPQLGAVIAFKFAWSFGRRAKRP